MRGDGDTVVCRVTSKLYDTDFDVLVAEWQAAGLKLPSVIRVHKIATLDSKLVEVKMGHINDEAKQQVQEKFKILVQ